MRATELAKLLADQAESVCRLLLPQGKRKGAEWECGSLDGEPGGSLRIHLTGQKAGVWSDFSTGESGDMVGLWMAVKRMELKEACAEIKAHLGITERNPNPPTKVYARPSRDGVKNLSDEHLQWLTEERKIPKAIIAAYKLATRGEWLMFPYFRDGELIAAKYRKLPKGFMQDANCEPCLFGWQAIKPTARKIVICEGEMDALAWATYGAQALSVPMGAGTGAKHNWIDSEFERLDLMDEIWLSFDMDEAGQSSISELVARLGADRCRIVELPRKDANQCLIDGIDPHVMHDCLTKAKSQDPAELKHAAEFEDSMLAESYRKDEGLTLPWPKTHAKVKLRRGETSIFAGINGHGKSAVVNHVIVDCAIVQNAKVCGVSMEYRIPKWLHRLTTTATGLANPTDEYRREFYRKLSKNLLVFDVAGAAKAERILEVFKYAAKRYGVELFVIDNLTKCGFADDDYSGQKQFVEAISDFARRENVHVAIVAHMRKGEGGEEKPSGKFGIKGSGGITDMVDTVVEVWRNKRKEKAIATAEREGTDTDAAKEPDSILFVHKQRETGEEPTINLWYDRDVMQFMSSPDHKPQAVGGHLRLAQ